jgi:hypothetical protein
MSVRARRPRPRESQLQPAPLPPAAGDKPPGEGQQDARIYQAWVRDLELEVSVRGGYLF